MDVFRNHPGGKLLYVIKFGCWCLSVTKELILIYCCFMNILTFHCERSEVSSVLSLSVRFKGIQIVVLSDEWGQNLSTVNLSTVFWSF